MMKTGLLMMTLLATSITIVTPSFAQTSINCHFGDKLTPLDNIFENDLAVKAFVEKHPNAIRYIAIDESSPPNGELSFTIENDQEKEILLIEFTQNENGCYRPKHYIYTYDNGIIDATVRNSLSNFTEIMDLMKLDDKKIDDFYTKNCNTVLLDYVLADAKPHFCKYDNENSIHMYLQKYIGGQIEINIPDKTMDALFYNCALNDDFFVLDNGEEIQYETIAENNTRIFKMELPQGYNKVEIIGFVNLSGNEHEFCGSIWGDDSRYISPSLQTKIGVDPWIVQCNDTLFLMLKPAEFSNAVCVTEHTMTKLTERGWRPIIDTS